LRDIPCRVQVPPSASGCAGRGRVVFDGRHCTLAAGEACVGARGAFDSFTECAWACAAEHCNATIQSSSGNFLDGYHPDDRWDSVLESECNTGQYAWESPVTFEGCPWQPGHDFHCSRAPEWTRFLCSKDHLYARELNARAARALSLLPFVDRVLCWY
jgi:hypothetical protein